MMRRFVLSSAVLATLAAALPALSVSARADDQFVDGFEDLPLMPGLSQEPGRVVQFDSPYGRIVESWAMGDLKRDAVAKFYDATLPQLGWVADGPGRFRRQGEILLLDIHRKGAGVEVHYRDSPPRQKP